HIVKSIVRVLRLNEDLAETIALAHDIGHPPFGHAGEEALHSIMKDHGGFNHNIQGLRVVDLLEERYPNFKGLNLSWEVREGIAKHITSLNQYSLVNIQLEPDSLPTLEAQVVDIADEIAYDTHDLDDGITSNLIDDKELEKVELWHRISTGFTSKNLNLSKEIMKYQIIRVLIDIQVRDLINNSEQNIKNFNIKTIEDVRKCKNRLISFSDKMKEEKKPLKEFLTKNLYNHYKVVRMSDKAKRFIKELFEIYISKPEQLPYSTQKRINLEGSYRAVCDYIAGMTDRYALEEYKKLFDPLVKV
ncbi:MAG: HD domain-containing protein, partial [Candidatus Omnitrophica bacterium]|nr:HD domain-containing protein [Candidatus Omnitrophota bacterium]